MVDGIGLALRRGQISTTARRYLVVTRDASTSAATLSTFIDDQLDATKRCRQHDSYP
jgi:hypothetical protein